MKLPDPNTKAISVASHYEVDPNGRFKPSAITTIVFDNGEVWERSFPDAEYGPLWTRVHPESLEVRGG